MARLKESGFILLLTLPWTLLIPLSPSATMAPQILGKSFSIIHETHQNTTYIIQRIIDRDYWYAQAEKDLARRLQFYGDKKPKAK